MLPKPVLVALCLLIAGPAHAGGFLADALRQSGTIDRSTAQALDSAHSKLGTAVDDLKSSNRPGQSRAVGESKTCVTPRGQCPLSSAGVHGTLCFCDIDAETVIGRAQ
jgi:hypothetical protein